MIYALALISVYCLLVTFYCFKFAITVLKVQDALQESIEVIDEKYENINQILARPLFYDSPEVRKVLKDIGDTREALIDVSDSLTWSLNKKNDVEDNIINEG